MISRIHRVIPPTSPGGAHRLRRTGVRHDRPLGARRLAPQVLSLAIAALVSAVPLAKAANASSLCPDILYLIEQSKSRFSALRGNTGSEFGDYDATFVLPGAWYCVVLEGKEKASYRCAWKYPLGDERARTAFQRFAKEMRNCIGDMAEERTDRPVNHPDIYASHYYVLPGGEASVALKNKSALSSTLVSIGIDGFTKAK